MSSPNFVEPLLKTIEADTKTVFNSCAVIVPAIVAFPFTVKSPVFVNEPVTVKSFDVIDESSILVLPNTNELAETELKTTSLVVATA